MLYRVNVIMRHPKKARSGSGLPFPSPGDLPYPGIELGSPALQADSLPTEPPGKTLIKPKGQPVLILCSRAQEPQVPSPCVAVTEGHVP